MYSSHSTWPSIPASHARGPRSTTRRRTLHKVGPIGFSGFLLKGHRCALFLFCRNYLLDSLYKDLRSLSYTEDTHIPTGESGTGHISDGELELDALPTVSSSRTIESRHIPSPLSAMSIRGLFPTKHETSSTMQSGLARTLFSLCFEEYVFSPSKYPH